jgi:ATP-dependent RNA helicase SUPV3L1/SUV3
MPPPRNVTAVLGPTNTGKTHLAVERMLAHPTGMIGLPLRLLAREVYDRVRARVGEHAVALVTGEEKIIPPEPRFWVSTVEAMPSDLKVSFLAIDEVQLAADLERGHVFTDRLLTRRGQTETMLLGAATMRGLIERLLPGTNFISRPRFSKLSYSGQKKLTRLPRRSAIVAFSAEMVYAMAELIRRQRGGAAVVLGALSPRTRNAQMALFQSGDVDHVVATDAIGMGLNMDLDHVAFASTRKFDGFSFRQLTAAELGQIAGRAGRYMNDGTFGVTAEAEPFSAELVGDLEDHRFEPVRVLQWRNRNLSFSSLTALRASLAAPPPTRELTRAQASFDVEALELLARDDEIAALASTPATVELLWEVCQVPDYRNISGAEHATLVARVFRFLTADDGRIPEDWFARQLSYCNRTEGDIDTLATRIAHIRTWTFIANRDWLADPLHWQLRARSIEDRLSDALHERLTQRFIDRRTSVLMRRLRQKEDVMSSVEEDGGVFVEGAFVGRLVGFRFLPEGDAASAKAVRSASLQAVNRELLGRAQALAAAPDPDFSLTRDGQIIWHGCPVARLSAGTGPLKPKVQLIADELLAGEDRDAVAFRIEKFLSRHIGTVLEPLLKLEAAEELNGIERGLAFRLVESMGIVPREEIADDVKALSQDGRAALRRHGVRFGAFHIFIPVLLKPAATSLRLLLWGLGLERDGRLAIENLPPVPGQGLTSVPFDRTTPRGFYRMAGFRICGERCVRIDMLERLADTIRDRVFWRPRFPSEARPPGSVEGGGFAIVPDMMSLVGCSGDEFTGILRSLGFRSERRRIEPTAPALSQPPSEPPVGATPEAPSDPGPSDPGPTDPAPADPVPARPEPEEPPPPPSEPDINPEGPGGPEIAPPDLPVPEIPPPAGTLGAAVLSPGASAEAVVLEVWWPRDTGPFRRKKPRANSGRRRSQHPPAKVETAAEPVPVTAAAGTEPAPARPPRPERLKRRPRRNEDGKQRRGEDGKSRGSDGTEERPKRPPPRREEPRVVVDGPFAVLGALRDKLAQTKK